MPDENKCRAEDNDPICLNCKYCVEPGYNDFGKRRCARFCDVVDGKPFRCDLVRYGAPDSAKDGPCGIEGKFFEPKPMPPKKLNFWKRLLLGQQSTEK